uniref:Taste receptor type 2 n=1 Tax=Nannospalax galili TaxID=1026970 RepID=A0A0N9N8Y0_NANGA|nr:taste receptor type 2 member 14 [Nannospalax galili]ALG93048.1 taste receptor type 2 member 14 [Nannospalax galili]ALG93054.1 taste receptor type 2 member 14 [Nannospalax galili]ALG93066.1 taste receptor type 2 member 14 [Nannospalax galili]ALG93070.1 taste receptor type 2 member 14 [Nannospalax galili]
MFQELNLFVFAASVVFNFVGLIVSLFIIVVIYKTWVRSRRLSSSDRILFSLGVTRFLTLVLFLLKTVYLSSNGKKSVYFSMAFVFCWKFLDSNSLWLVTLLNSLYCVKITNFQHPMFLLLKRNISAKTTRMLLACLLISAFTTLLYLVLSQVSRFPEHMTGRNDTVFDFSEGILILAASLALSSLFQFVLNVTFASVLIHSLRRHIQRMRRNSTGFWNPQTEAHLGAVKLMTCFLLLYIPYSVATLFYLPSSGKDLRAYAVCVIITAVYPPGHSVLIIFTHSKLKTKAKKILRFYK